MNYKKKPILVLSIIFSLIISLLFMRILAFSLTNFNSSNSTPKNIIDLDLIKTSYAVDLTGFPIYIDDSDPNYNWSKTAAENAWCEDLGGSYRIQNVIINNLGSQNSSVIIKNSNVIFVIRNCLFYNTADYGWDNDESNGIYLYNVQNGFINNNNLSECAKGITLDHSDYNSVSSNFVSNNDDQGVYVTSSNNNQLYNNTISDNRYGIDLSSSHSNEIDENFIFRNYRYDEDSGIYVWQSTANNITENSIYESPRAIDLRYSDSNTISSNLVFSNGMGIEIIYSSSGNIFYGNSIYNNGKMLEDLPYYSPGGTGIYCTAGNNYVVDNNNIYNNSGRGIDFRNTNNLNITNNNFWNNSLDDIYLKDTTNFRLTDNSMIGPALFLDIPYSTLSGANIDTTNTANGKPIYFYKDQDYLNAGDFSNAGQIYLYGCDFATISNLNFVNATTGITLRKCYNNSISVIESSYNSRWGIGLLNCLNNVISNVNVFESGFYTNYYQSSGLYLENCYNNKIIDNTISNNVLQGINMINCSKNIITGNLAISNGIYISGANNSYVYNNTSNYGFTIAKYGEDVTDWIEVNGTWTEVWIFWAAIHNLTFVNNIGSATIDSVNNSIIAYNKANNGPGWGLSITDAKDCLIYENEAKYNDELGIGLYESRDTDLFNNTAIENFHFNVYGYDPEGYGFIIEDCENVKVYNNYAFKNGDGILVSGSRDCEIKENILNNNGDVKKEGIVYVGPITEQYGLFLDNSEFINVLKNSINNNYVKMQNSHNNSLILNDITWGGFILDHCNQNVILGNTIFRGDRGVDLVDSSYNHILNNSITSMQCFRELGYCIGNVFENNYCKEELPYFPLREIMTIIGVAGVLGLNIPLYIKKRKKR